MVDERSTVNLARVVEALNRLPADSRRLALDALRECDLNTRYYTLRDGRIDAVYISGCR